MSLTGRRTKKQTKEEIWQATSRIDLECKDCGRMVFDVSADTKSVTCSRCVQKMAAPPELPKKAVPEEKRPRGWHLKSRYVAPDGTVYHKGEKVDERMAKSNGDDRRVVSSTNTGRKKAKASNRANKPDRKRSGRSKASSADKLAPRTRKVFRKK